ncbi:unnamed protein product [uncultured bacterium]|nr:unnamed protein product [uncultured bacterium]
MIDWAKGGAGRMLKRAQRRTFDRRRPHAAPNLIDKVLAMTAPLAALARLGERGRLFLLRRPYRQIGVVQPLTLYDAITRFIDRENARVAAWNAEHPDRLRSKLPPSTRILFRGSVATEHYRVSGGDIRVAQAVLNHSRADTYIAPWRTAPMRIPTSSLRTDRCGSDRGNSHRTEGAAHRH